LAFANLDFTVAHFCIRAERSVVVVVNGPRIRFPDMYFTEFVVCNEAAIADVFAIDEHGIGLVWL